MELYETDLNLETDSLYVEKVSIYSYPDAAKVASAWALAANKKANLTNSAEEKTQFYACADVSNCMESELFSPWRSREVYVCKDSTGHSQGMMVVEASYDGVYVAYLGTV